LWLKALVTTIAAADKAAASIWIRHITAYRVLNLKIWISLNLISLRRVVDLRHPAIIIIPAQSQE